MIWEWEGSNYHGQTFFRVASNVDYVTWMCNKSKTKPQCWPAFEAFCKSIADSPAFSKLRATFHDDPGAAFEYLDGSFNQGFGRRPPQVSRSPSMASLDEMHAHGNDTLNGMRFLELANDPNAKLFAQWVLTKDEFERTTGSNSAATSLFGDGEQDVAEDVRTCIHEKGVPFQEGKMYDIVYAAPNGHATYRIIYLKPVQLRDGAGISVSRVSAGGRVTPASLYLDKIVEIKAAAADLD
jgi:hypothetical protein